MWLWQMGSVSCITCIRGWKDGNACSILWAYLVNFPVITLMTDNLPNVLVTLRKESQDKIIIAHLVICCFLKVL